MKNLEEKIDPHLMEIAIQRVMKMLAVHYGEQSEFILHDYEHGPERTVIAIENNGLTGRKIGDPSSNLGFELLRYDGKSEINDCYGYNVYFKNGRVFRSSTMYLKDENNKMVGAFCINTDITPLIGVRSFINSLTPEEDEPLKVDEFFPRDVSEILDTLISNYNEELHGRDPRKLSTAEKIDAVRYFDSKGAFLITKAGRSICEYLDISKGTLYSYLSRIREENKHDE